MEGPIACGLTRQMGVENRGLLLQGEIASQADRLFAQAREQVQTVYLDPPFNTGKRFEMKARVGEAGYRSGGPTVSVPAYEDRWESREAYLAMMRETLELCHALLSREGVLFLHADMRMIAHLRLLMDEIFGEKHFLNEIIWSYHSGGWARSFFPRKHDTILFYSKSADYYFNLKAVPSGKAESRSNHLRRSVDEEGRSYRSIVSGGKEYRYYDDAPVYPDDVWDDLAHLQQKDPERTGFETQKPLRLLDRIIRCSSRENDLVCDLFSGSGTTALAAMQANRRFLCLDRSPVAIATAEKRLSALPEKKRKKAKEALGYTVEAPCVMDEARAETEVYPAIASFTVRLADFTCPQAEAAGIHGLDAVDQWAAGFLADGVFCRCAASVRSAAHPALEETLEMPVWDGEPCVLTVDLWGNRRFFLPARRV